MKVSKEVKVGFREQSKAVTAEVDIRYTDTDLDNTVILEEVKTLMDQALKYSKVRTTNKL